MKASTDRGRHGARGLRHGAAALALLVAGCVRPPETPDPPPSMSFESEADARLPSEWPSYHGDLAGTRYSPLNQLQRGNVANLTLAWSYPLAHARQGSDRSEATPLVADGMLYMVAADRIVALQPETGAEIWRHRRAGAGPSRRGLAFRPGDGELESRLYFTSGGRLVALDARTGRRVAFGARGEVDADAVPDAVPLVFRDLVVVPAASGVHAYDARTGVERWTFDAADFVAARESAGPRIVDAVHAEPAFSLTADRDRGLLYTAWRAPVSAEPTEVGLSLAGSVIALDAYDGTVRWSFATVRDDPWGRGLSAAPALLDLTVAGREVAALAVIGSAGYLYLLDRVRGEPLFEVEEHWVPGGGRLRVQPVPLRPPPLARVAYRSADAVSASDTDEAHASICAELAAEGSVFFPGPWGGAGWGGAAVDPILGYVFVVVTNVGAVVPPADRPAPSVPTGFWRGMAAPGSSESVADGGGRVWPCQKPPWGELVAVHAASGSVAWRVPLGDTRSLPEDRRATGRPAHGGPIVTAAGLVLIGAADDGRLRVFDARSGAALWAGALPASGYAVPATYQGRDGKQYVAITAAGAPAGEGSGPALVVLALP